MQFDTMQIGQASICQKLCKSDIYIFQQAIFQRFINIHIWQSDQKTVSSQYHCFCMKIPLSIKSKSPFLHRLSTDFGGRKCPENDVGSTGR